MWVVGVLVVVAVVGIVVVGVVVWRRRRRRQRGGGRGDGAGSHRAVKHVKIVAHDASVGDVFDDVFDEIDQ
jgi:hypothetical protein